LELECFRAEARVRGQWEAHEGRLVEHLAELQCQLRGKKTEEPLPRLKMDELVEGSQNSNLTAKTILTPANMSKNKQPECRLPKSVQW